jgi:hypothetical protein
MGAQEAALATSYVPSFLVVELEAVYFMLALVVVSVETGTPLMPFSPGWLLPLSMPTLVTPESEATGASPGALDSVWPGALATPSPWTVSFCQSPCRWKRGRETYSELASWLPSRRYQSHRESWSEAL